MVNQQSSPNAPLIVAINGDRKMITI